MENIQEEILKILLYGTLMDTNQNIGLPTIIKGRIIDFGPFPGLILDEKGINIECSIISANKANIKTMDYYECVQDNYYSREEVIIPEIIYGNILYKDHKVSYYRPRGVFLEYSIYGTAKEILPSNKPFNWLEYENAGKTFDTKDISTEELVRLAES